MTIFFWIIVVIICIHLFDAIINFFARQLERKWYDIF